jgi:glycogen(starch) synthase
VGGIYTVIKTKVPVTVREFGERYCLIGPLSWKTAPMEVEQLEPSGKIKECLDKMSEQGVRYLFGRWLVEGAPYVLLFDTASVASRLDEWKGDLWRVAGIPSPAGDQETNEAILFGYLVAWFLELISNSVRFFFFFLQKKNTLLTCFIYIVSTGSRFTSTSYYCTFS